MKDILTTIIILGAIILVVGTPLLLPTLEYCNDDEILIEIKDKYIKTDNGKGRYLIVDTKNNTYEIHDMLFKGLWNSTDLYNKFDVKKEYTVKKCGLRIPFFSQYPTIYKIKE